MNLGFRKDFADEVDWSLHVESVAFLLMLHHDRRTDDVSSHENVE
jgi:hypothetical protein